MIELGREVPAARAHVRAAWVEALPSGAELIRLPGAVLAELPREFQRATIRWAGAVLPRGGSLLVEVPHDDPRLRLGHVARFVEDAGLAPPELVRREPLTVRIRA